MAVFSDVVMKASEVGATAGTFGSVGTISLRSDAQRLLGHVLMAVHVTGKAAEAVQGRFKINSVDIPTMDTIDKNGPPHHGGSPATNNMGAPVYPEWVPCMHKLKGSEDIKYEFTTQKPDPTNGCLVACAAVYEARADIMSVEAAKRFVDDYMSPDPLAGGYVSCHKDAVTGTSATLLSEPVSTGMDLPAVAEKMRTLGLGVVPDAYEEVELMGYVELTSKLPDFSPQKYILPGMDAPLGTPVGDGFHMSHPLNYRMDFPNTGGKKQIIAAYANMAAARATGSDTVSVDLGYGVSSVAGALEGRMVA